MRELLHKCKRRLRFSLLTLLVVVCVTGGFAGYWLQQRRETEAAYEQLMKTIAGFQAGVFTWDKFIADNRRYCFEYADVPFTNVRPVLEEYRDHLIADLSLVERALWNDFDAREERIREVRSYLDEASRWVEQGYPSGNR
jgi:hypothetical protein